MEGEPSRRDAADSGSVRIDSSADSLAMHAERIAKALEAQCEELRCWSPKARGAHAGCSGDAWFEFESATAPRTIPSRHLYLAGRVSEIIQRSGPSAWVRLLQGSALSPLGIRPAFTARRSNHGRETW